MNIVEKNEYKVIANKSCICFSKSFKVPVLHFKTIDSKFQDPMSRAVALKMGNIV